MFTFIKSVVPDQVKELLKDVTSAQGRQWIEKKEMRMAEANKKLASDSIQKLLEPDLFKIEGDLLVNRKAMHSFVSPFLWLNVKNLTLS